MEKTDEPKTEIEAPRASKALPYLGFLITAVWLVGLAVYVGLNFHRVASLRPNELADFAAGAFAPLAFLWLVLGFFQQGEELRYSGRALWLQGEELRNSVEQQRELVNVSREQLLFESAALKHQQDELRRKARPIFEITPGSTQRLADSELRVIFKITNHGRPCTDVKVHLGNPHRPITKSILATGDFINFQTDFDDFRNSATVFISYIDEHLLPDEHTCKIDYDKETGFDIKTVKPNQDQVP